MQLRSGELPLLRQMVRQLAGMSPGARLIEGRIGPVAEAVGCGNMNELYFRIRYGDDSRLRQRIVDAITTATPPPFGR
jgi:hypothetical protein